MDVDDNRYLEIIDVKNFDELKELYFCNEDCNKDLSEAAEILTRSNDAFFNSLAVAQKQIKELSEDPYVNNVNVLYINLKDDYEKLKQSFNDLREKYQNNEQKHESDTEQIQREHEMDVNKLNNEFKILTADLEDTIFKLKSDLENKEADFLNEMHRSQATSAFRYDEMESQLQNSLSETNQKLRESNTVNNVLRCELMSLKNDFTFSVNNAEQVNNEKIEALEDRLLFTENQLRIAQEKLFERRCSNVPKFSSSKVKYAAQGNAAKYVRLQQNEGIGTYASTLANNNLPSDKVLTKQMTPEKENTSVSLETNLKQNLKQTPVNSMYTPLPVQVNSNENDNTIDDAITRNIYKDNKRKSWSLKKSDSLPPLLQVTNTSEKKKRKLYSPTKFLDDLITKPD